jgi:CBS domain containing-hemolysin-like protein
VEGDLLFLVFLIFLSSVFSGGEVAFISLSQAKVKSFSEKKDPVYHIIAKLKKNPQKLLITILIGNNLVNIGASVVSAAYAIRLFGSQSLALVTAILTFLILLFGEIMPKSFAQKHAVSIAKTLAYPFLILEYILWPIIIFFEFIIKLFMKLGGDKKITSITEEELIAMVDIGKEEGTIEAHEQTFITNILEFSDTQVEEVMTPRLKIKALEANTSLQDALQFFMEQSHSRIPVYEKNIDNIIGILTIKNILQYINTKNLNKKVKEAELLEPLIVPHSKAIKALFNDFKHKRVHLAIVVDELGQVVGLVTLEDLLEEIVGEIEDEEDIHEVLIKKIDNQTWMVEGKTPIETVEEELKLNFEEIFPIHKPISFIILAVLKRFPKTGEKIELPQVTLIVEQMGKKRIERVKIIKKGEE